MPKNRFRSLNATPPEGWYEYSLGGEFKRSRYKTEIAAQARALRAKHGLETVGDGFAYVMEQMCPRMPDGFCTEPSGVKVLKTVAVKEKTKALFALPAAASDEIERRLRACANCAGNVTQGYCPGCSGLTDWARSGFGPGRGALPPDAAVGVCLHEEVLISALATPAVPPLAGSGHPEACWLVKEGSRG